jgi:predicted TIM-barrel fold metal-dependent hydrolase
VKTAVFDTDAHVEESDETFASLAGLEQFAGAAPRVIEGERRAFWLIEGRTFPKLSGNGVHTFGSPHAKRAAGHVDPERRARVESQELRDPKARLQDMDAEGIDVSVVFPTLFLVWPLADDPALARALCRSYNDWIAAKCAATGGRIRWVATVPLPDVEGSVEEVAHAKRLGACGVMTLGTAGGTNLGNRTLDPFYAACELNALPVCVHVGWSYPPLSQLYDKVYEALITPFVLPLFMGFSAILSNGVLERFPKLKVGFFEAGVEWVPYWLDRIEEGGPAGPQSRGLRKRRKNLFQLRARREAHCHGRRGHRRRLHRVLIGPAARPSRLRRAESFRREDRCGGKYQAQDPRQRRALFYTVACAEPGSGRSASSAASWNGTPFGRTIDTVRDRA